MATHRNTIYMLRLKRNQGCCIAVMLFDYNSGITLRSINLSQYKLQIFKLQCLDYRLPGNTTLSYSARLLSTPPAVNYGRCMAFVTNVLIVEPIVYCAVLLKEDKTGRRVIYVSNMYYNALVVIYSI